MADNQQIIQARGIRVEWDGELGVMTTSSAEGAELDIHDARACTKAMRELSGGRAVPLLVDLRGLKSQSKACRDYFAKDPEHIKTYSAVAIVASNALTRLIANFYMGINRPERPTRLFGTREEGIAWLTKDRPR